jgi:hypothetical protein
LGCFYTVDEIRKRLGRSTRPLKLCIFRSPAGLPFVSSVSSSSKDSAPQSAAESAVEDVTRWDRLLQTFRRFKFVTVAVLDGTVDDLGLSFALACDFVAGTPSAAYAPAASAAAVAADPARAATTGAQLPFWSLAGALAMHVGVANAQRYTASAGGAPAAVGAAADGSSGGMTHAELVQSGLLLQEVADTGLATLRDVLAVPLLARLPNRRGRTHMQTRNGLVASYAIKASEHIGHCLAVLNVNVDAALESDPQVVYAANCPHDADSAAALSVDEEADIGGGGGDDSEKGEEKKQKQKKTQLLVSFAEGVALEGLGTGTLFTLLGKVKAAATAGGCQRVVFRFPLPAATAESECAASPQRLVFSAEVQTLMNRVRACVKTCARVHARVSVCVAWRDVA